MTRLTYSKEANRQAHLQAETASSHEAEQILHLKRLLVTLKQHYENSLHQVHIQLQAEQSQRIAAQKDLEKVQAQLADSQKFHEEELHALREQQSTLKKLLKKAQEELKQQHHSSSRDDRLEMDRQQEAERLREEVQEAQKKLKVLEQDLLDNQQKAQTKIDHLQQLLEDHKQQEPELETVVSTTSSHHLRRELETIKRILAEGAQQTKALESRYIEILNEKIEFEHQNKQLQLQLEHQSSNLTAFQEQLHELDDRKKTLEMSLQAKESAWSESCQQQQELQAQLERLKEHMREKERIQDQYEQLKEEWKQLIERLEEAIEMRAQMNQHLNELEAIAANQETQLQEFAQQLQMLQQEKGSLESEREQFKILLDESEARLKVAQQHLAKKVKEAALLSEQLEEQQANLTDFAQTIEYQKTQLAQLQASVDFYQRQEKRLQEQLHEALKGTESQIIKWEEKYFRMYDKWQESENRVRDLKKLEEKYLHMQGLLANLGNFMGGAFNASHVLFHSGQEITERTVERTFSFEPPLASDSLFDAPSQETGSQEEKFDLFGMRQPPNKYNPPLPT